MLADLEFGSPEKTGHFLFIFDLKIEMFECSSFFFFGFVMVEAMLSRFCYYAMNFKTCDLVDCSSCKFSFLVA